MLPSVRNAAYRNLIPSEYVVKNIKFFRQNELDALSLIDMAVHQIKSEENLRHFFFLQVSDISSSPGVSLLLIVQGTLIAHKYSMNPFS